MTTKSALPTQLHLIFGAGAGPFQPSLPLPELPSSERAGVAKPWTN